MNGQEVNNLLYLQVMYAFTHIAEQTSEPFTRSYHSWTPRTRRTCRTLRCNIKQSALGHFKGENTKLDLLILLSFPLDEGFPMTRDGKYLPQPQYRSEMLIGHDIIPTEVRRRVWSRDWQYILFVTRQPDRTAHGRWVRGRHRPLTLPPETDGRLTLSQLQTYVEAVILI